MTAIFPTASAVNCVPDADGVYKPDGWEAVKDFYPVCAGCTSDCQLVRQAHLRIPGGFSGTGSTGVGSYMMFLKDMTDLGEQDPSIQVQFYLALIRYLWWLDWVVSGNVAYNSAFAAEDGGEFTQGWFFMASGSGSTITITNEPGTGFDNPKRLFIAGSRYTSLQPGDEIWFGDRRALILTWPTYGVSTTSISVAPGFAAFTDESILCQRQTPFEYEYFQPHRGLFVHQKSSGAIFSAAAEAGAIALLDAAGNDCRIAYPIPWAANYEGTFRVMATIGSIVQDITDQILKDFPGLGAGARLRFLYNGATHRTTVNLQGLTQYNIFVIHYCPAVIDQENPAATSADAWMPMHHGCKHCVIIHAGNVSIQTSDPGAIGAKGTAQDSNGLVFHCTRLDEPGVLINTFTDRCNQSECPYYVHHRPHVWTQAFMAQILMGQGTYLRQLAVGLTPHVWGLNCCRSLGSIAGYASYTGEGLADQENLIWFKANADGTQGSLGYHELKPEVDRELNEGPIYQLVNGLYLEDLRGAYCQGVPFEKLDPAGGQGSAATGIYDDGGYGYQDMAQVPGRRWPRNSPIGPPGSLNTPDGPSEGEIQQCRDHKIRLPGIIKGKAKTIDSHFITFGGGAMTISLSPFGSWILPIKLEGDEQCARIWKAGLLDTNQVLALKMRPEIVAVRYTSGAGVTALKYFMCSGGAVKMANHLSITNPAATGRHTIGDPRMKTYRGDTVRLIHDDLAAYAECKLTVIWACAHCPTALGGEVYSGDVPDHDPPVLLTDGPVAQNVPDWYFDDDDNRLLCDVILLDLPNAGLTGRLRAYLIANGMPSDTKIEVCTFSVFPPLRYVDGSGGSLVFADTDYRVQLRHLEHTGTGVIVEDTISGADIDYDPANGKIVVSSAKVSAWSQKNEHCIEILMLGGAKGCYLYDRTGSNPKEIMDEYWAALKKAEWFAINNFVNPRKLYMVPVTPQLEHDPLMIAFGPHLPPYTAVGTWDETDDYYLSDGSQAVEMYMDYGRADDWGNVGFHDWDQARWAVAMTMLGWQIQKDLFSALTAAQIKAAYVEIRYDRASLNYYTFNYDRDRVPQWLPAGTVQELDPLQLRVLVFEIEEHHGAVLPYKITLNYLGISDAFTVPAADEGKWYPVDITDAMQAAAGVAGDILFMLAPNLPNLDVGTLATMENINDVFHAVYEDISEVWDNGGLGGLKDKVTHIGYGYEAWYKNPQFRNCRIALDHEICAVAETVPQRYYDSNHGGNVPPMIE